MIERMTKQRDLFSWIKQVSFPSNTLDPSGGTGIELLTQFLL